MTDFENITTVGTGILGGQIAYATAYAGFNVACVDVTDEALEKAKKYHQLLARTYDSDVPGAKDGKSAAALTRLRYTTDLADGLKDCDLVIESVTEDEEIKTQVWTKVGELAPPKTIFATNSSTMLPSTFMSASGRPAQFLSLHFTYQVHKLNVTEVMPTSETSDETYDKVVAFARAQGTKPIQLRREQPGYLINSMLLPMAFSAIELWVNGVASHEDIDRAWTGGTGASVGPFHLIDISGMTQAKAMSLMMGGDAGNKFAQIVQERFIDKGKMGVSTGEGFYKYNADGSRVDEQPKYGIGQEGGSSGS